MFKYILEGAGNIDWMAVSALVTFFTIFVLSAVLILRSDRNFIEKMSNLPLEDTHSKTVETEMRHEK